MFRRSSMCSKPNFLKLLFLSLKLRLLGFNRAASERFPASTAYRNGRYWIESYNLEKKFHDVGIKRFRFYTRRENSG